MSEIGKMKMGEPVAELPGPEGSIRNDFAEIAAAMNAHRGQWIPLECTTPQVATKRRAAIGGSRWFKALGGEIATRKNVIYVRVPA